MVKFCMPEDKEKRNRTDFYWVMLLMYTIWEKLEHFATWYSSEIFVNIKSFWLFFWGGGGGGTNVPKYIFKTI